MVRGLQERAARAFPAEHVQTVRGWWLRHSPGCSWWLESVLPHADASADELVRRVEGAERFYSDRRASARFQISPPACPPDLDTLLAARGYRRESPMSLQVASTEHALERVPAGSVRVRLDDHQSNTWLTVWNAVHGAGDDADPGSERDMLARVEPPSAYARALIGDDVVAVGRAVADTGWAGLFGMATVPEARGKGAARTVLAALAAWAHSLQAERLYLQVERDNFAALRLYERAGFTELCGYHYRTAT